MPFVLESRRKKIETLRSRYPDAMILDVTSKGELPWVKFSPFYPHGGIPVPFSPGWVSASVEGAWQGSKVFESADIDVTKFAVTTMKGLKRSSRSFGKVLGHRKGVEGEALLPYLEARQSIYLPLYRWVLENALQREVEELRAEGENRQIVLLDYETNGDPSDLSKPLSHASLVIHYIEGRWPEEGEPA